MIINIIHNKSIKNLNNSIAIRLDKDARSK